MGPTLERAREALRHGGGDPAIRSADVDALAGVEGIGRALAERIRERLR